MENAESRTSKVDLDWSDPKTWKICLMVGDSQFNQYNETNNRQYLDAAIENTVAALDRFRQSPEIEFDPSDYLANLGLMYMTRFENLSDPKDLKLAVEKTREAQRLCPMEKASYPQMNYMLSMVLATEYEQTGPISLLTDSIAFGQIAVDQGDETNIELYGEFLTNLSDRLQSQFEISSDEQFLTKAIQLSEKAIKIATESCSGLPEWINSLGNALRSRFELYGVDDDIDRAIDCADAAERYGETFKKPSHGFSSNLSSQLARKYERTGDDECLRRAIDSAERAYTAIPKGNISTVLLMVNLASTTRNLFHHSGDMLLLDRAIKLLQDVLKLISVNHVEYPKTLFSLSNIVMTKFEHTGSYELLQKAIQLNKDVRKCDVQGTRLWPKILLDTSLLHYYKYQWTGRAKVLEQALEFIAQAWNAAKPGDLDLPMILSTQSMLFLRRFERDGRRTDLSEAVTIERRAIEITPPKHPNKSRRLNGLGIAFQTAYKRSHDFEDLERSICEFDKAMRSMVEDVIALASFQINKSNTYLMMFEYSKKDKYLNQALEIINMIDPSTVVNSQERARLLSSIAQILKERVKTQRPTEKDLENITRLARQALQSTNATHPDFVLMSKNLGDCFMLSQNPDVQGQAMQHYQEAWEGENGMPAHRLAAAQSYLLLFQALFAKARTDALLDLKYAAEMARAVVLLSTSIGDISLGQQDKQVALSKGAGLAASACSLALESGRSAEDALDVLETGRGVIIGQLLDRQSDLTQLKEADASIAARFEELRTDANSSFEAFDNETDAKLRHAMQNKRLQANIKLQELSDQIREIPGLKRFLLGPDRVERHALSQASKQALVVINITRIRSDAIFVTSYGTHHCPLNELRYDTVINWVQQRVTGRTNMQEFAGQNTLYLEFLEWLWRSCVEPILLTLSAQMPTSRGAKSQHRICWIGTGVGSQLPFHAAGIYARGRTDNSLSQTISSYIPTFKVLARAVEDARNPASSGGQHRLLSVLMPTTPGEDPLDSVEDEDRAIRAQLPAQTDIKTLRHECVAEILRQLQQYSIIHFACHGVTNFREPMQSHLILQRTTDNNTVVADPLTVRDVSELALREKKLAFLSACSTADNPALALADEVLHLASGFYVAGFTHVVATMWPTDDDISVQFARDFYKSLEQLRLTRPGPDLPVAEAVREAMLHLRQQIPTRPLLWAQYVHWGL